MENEQLKKWNDLWENGILGMSEKECSDALCFFHGRMKMNLRHGVITAGSVVQHLAKAVEYAKTKSLAKLQ